MSWIGRKDDEPHITVFEELGSKMLISAAPPLHADVAVWSQHYAWIRKARGVRQKSEKTLQ